MWSWSRLTDCIVAVAGSLPRATRTREEEIPGGPCGSGDWLWLIVSFSRDRIVEGRARRRTRTVVVEISTDRRWCEALDGVDRSSAIGESLSKEKTKEDVGTLVWFSVGEIVR